MNTSPSIFWGKLEEIRHTIKKIAPSDITVLIQGETGTGKRLVAKVIHSLSSRRDQPFIPMTCVAIPDEFVLLASGGTILLDEISDLCLHLQAKVMRMLESKEFQKAGLAGSADGSVRILAATKKDLRQAVDAGQFRKDLYYRLNVVTLKLPPLRERREDIVPLAEFFIAGRVNRMSARAKRLLKSYDWPGNVRELKNCMDRAVVLGDGKIIEPEDLPHSIRRCAKIIPAPLESLGHIEEGHIAKVLKYTDWDRRVAARILGITIKALGNKIDKYEIKGVKSRDKTLKLYKN